MTRNLKENKPFIKLFRTPRGFYLYSVNRNTVINISEEVYRYLDGKSDGDLSATALRELETLREENCLSSKRMNKICHPGLNSIGEIQNSRLNMICLQVTQACNLTCSYCPYANITNGKLQRDHANRFMNYETAKKAIDFYLEHSGDMERAGIGFYGGEPLLAFDLIKQVVEYANDRFLGKDLLFNLTTNGTLLTDEMIEFFADNKFSLMFSIDGPEKIHDVNRKRRDGNGSFQVAYGNLMKTYKKYFEKEIVDLLSVNAVLNPQNDIDEVLSFFYNDQFPKYLRVKMNLADEVQLDKRLKNEHLFAEKYLYQSFLARLDHLLLVNGLHFPESFENAVKNEEIANETLKKSQWSLPDVGSPGGPCIPGQKRLFVTVDGAFFPCERVSELCEDLKIGNVDVGFDLEKSVRAMNLATLTAEQCKNCWASQFCSLCAIRCEKDGKLCGEARLKECAGQRSLAEVSIGSFILSLECKTIYQRGK